METMMMRNKYIKAEVVDNNHSLFITYKLVEDGMEDEEVIFCRFIPSKTNSTKIVENDKKRLEREFNVTTSL